MFYVKKKHKICINKKMLLDNIKLQLKPGNMHNTCHE